MKTQILIRIHRIILQIALSVLMVYFFGLVAFLLCVAIILCEVPYPKFDLKINPWYRKHHIQELENQLKELVEMEKEVDRELADLESELDKNCPLCGRRYSEEDFIKQACSHCGKVND